MKKAAVCATQHFTTTRTASPRVTPTHRESAPHPPQQQSLSPSLTTPQRPELPRWRPRWTRMWRRGPRGRSKVARGAAGTQLQQTAMATAAGAAVGAVAKEARQGQRRRPGSGRRSGIRQRPLPGAGDMAGGGAQAAREAVGTAAGGRGPAAAATSGTQAAGGRRPCGRGKAVARQPQQRRGRRQWQRPGSAVGGGGTTARAAGGSRAARG